MPELVGIEDLSEGEGEPSMVAAPHPVDRSGVALSPTDDRLPDSTIPEKPEEELRVLALRSDGTPAAGLGIALLRRLRDGTVVRTAETFVTDENGVGRHPWNRVVVLGSHKAGLEAQIAGYHRPVVEFTASPLDPGTSEPYSSIDGQPLYLGPPADPVLLRIPPCGAIEVRAWAAPGAPFTFHGPVQLLTPGAVNRRDGPPGCVAMTLRRASTSP